MSSKAMSKKTKRAIINTILYILLFAGAFVCVYPLIFTVLAGLFSAREFNERLVELSFFPIPKAPTLQNFEVFLKSDSVVLRSLLNSLVRTGYSMICAVITSFIPGYVFSRLKFPAKNVLFLFLLATAMLPGTVTLLPTYIMFKRLAIYDTFWVYLVGGPVINILGTFIVIQSFQKIPKEIDEAAKIDGAGHMRIIWRVLFPLQIPIITYIVISMAIGVWNDWMTPFFFTSSDSLQTLPGAITRLSSTINQFVFPNYPLMITLGLAITLPCLMIFFIFQRYIVEGLANVGIKG